jgi:Cu2+-exporting ATPase
VAVALSVPVLLLAMGEGIPGFDLAGAIEQLATRLGLPHLMSVTWTQCVEAALATPVVL